MERQKDVDLELELAILEQPVDEQEESTRDAVLAREITNRAVSQAYGLSTVFCLLSGYRVNT
ncbi:hypothetical protein ACJ73_06318 [Blastomyces percursus]|uniref:Uncharacterized protein n=1 Tax=Blastomyces percursus TaxID=1658174 RepID=A0A1J9Q2M0_9EURO|nr:hypothetical protein ACJ73_06318 [Blastomyces percursus]